MWIKLLKRNLSESALWKMWEHHIGKSSMSFTGWQMWLKALFLFISDILNPEGIKESRQLLGQQCFDSCKQVKALTKCKSKMLKKLSDFLITFFFVLRFWNLWLKYFCFHYTGVCVEALWKFLAPFCKDCSTLLPPNQLLQIYIAQLVLCISHWASVDTTLSRYIYSAQEKVVWYWFSKIPKTSASNNQKNK